MDVSKDIRYVGVDDHQVDLFEGQFIVPNGMSYNSYVVLDDKIAVMDTVDQNFTDEWLGNVERELGGRKPDYLVVHHMEPDHSANVAIFMEKYPEATVVATKLAFMMMKNFFGNEYEERRIVVEEGGKLSLGNHEFTFILAHMVHWPEVFMSYDSKDKALFSADAFGKFGALDVEDNWVDESRRYYVGIVQKYGKPVQAVLNKASSLDISMICPLHGPVLKENLGYYIDKYSTWAAYEPEDEGVVIAYNSIYGNTKKAVDFLADKLKEKGCLTVIVDDLARMDMAKAVEDAFHYDRLVLVSPTYNANVFPYMEDFIRHLTGRGFQKRKVALMENGSWAPLANKVMREMLSGCKDITYASQDITIRSAMTEENMNQIEELAAELA